MNLYLWRIWVIYVVMLQEDKKKSNLKIKSIVSIQFKKMHVISQIFIELKNIGISYKNWGEFYGRYQAWYWNGKRKLATCYLQANAPNILFEIAEILCATKHMPWPRNLSKVKLFHWFPFCTFPNPKLQIFLFKVLEI